MLIGLSNNNMLISKEINQVSLVKELETAENQRDLDKIEVLFDSNAVLYTTELMPVTGKKFIRSMYGHVFKRKEIEKVSYNVNSTDSEGKYYLEEGDLIIKKVNQEPIHLPFKVKFEKQKENFFIVEISFGEKELLIKELPKLPKPTGEYNIGQQSFFFNRDESSNCRILAFQIWYPTNDSSEKKQPFRSKEILSASSSFSGFPPFILSSFSSIKSNSILKATPSKENQFPILIYNHGYGGYTQVYQTVFEDLVSHGYIVVSIGHEDESALFIDANENVISNSPKNAFYSSRAPELVGSIIGKWQSVILSSNNSTENSKAYKKMLKLTPLHNESTRLWASDTKTVISKLNILHKDRKENLYNIFDLDNIGVFGHSLGGATAGQLCFGNSKIKAGINLDGFQFGELYNNSLEVPFMFISSNRENDRYLRALTFMNSAKTTCYQVALKGFTHDSFTDFANVLSGDYRKIDLQRRLIKSFFDKHLKNREMDLKSLKSDYEEIYNVITNDL